MLYLLGSVFFLVAGSIRSRIIDPGNAAATADSIRASATLVRGGLMIDLASIVTYLFMALALYQLLKHVNQLAAAAMVLFVTVGAPMGTFALVNQYSALTIATRADYTTALGRAGADALVMMFIDTQINARAINEVIAGLWLLPLGYLVIKSGYFPKVLGVLLIIGGFAWVAHLAVLLLAPDLAGIASGLVLGTTGEVLFIVWLLVKGAHVLPSRQVGKRTSPER